MQGQWYKSEIKHAQPPKWVGSTKGDRVRMEGYPERRYAATSSKAGAPPKWVWYGALKIEEWKGGGLVPPNKVWWNSGEGGRQPRCTSCTTTHERGRFKPRRDLQRVWLVGQIRLPIKTMELPDRTFVQD